MIYFVMKFIFISDVNSNLKCSNQQKCFINALIM